MSAVNVVNPELDLDPDALAWPGKQRNNPAFKRAVARLFGRSDGSIVRAVDDFLSKDPGNLDHHSLRLIAAAAPHFSDVNHVAHMIASLPVTKMEVAVAQLDLEATSAQFGAILPSFRSETNRKLVLDLVRRGTMHVLENSTPARVPAEGRVLIEVQLDEQLRGRTFRDLAIVLASPFATPRHLDKAIDQLDSWISALPTIVDENDRRELNQNIDTTLAMLVDAGMSDEQLRRMWSVVKYFVPSDDYIMREGSIAVADDERLVSLDARGVLEFVRNASLVEGSDDQTLDVIHGVLLNRPELPEYLAREIAQHEVTLQPDPNVRLALARIDHYAKSSTPMKRMSDDDLDELVRISTPPSEWDASWITFICNPTTLSAVVQHVDSMTYDALESLVQRSDLTSEQLSSIIESVDMERRDWADSTISLGFVGLAESSSITDAGLVRLIEKLPRSIDPEVRQSALELVGCNPASGPEVYRLMRASGSERVLAKVASRTKSPAMHGLLTEATILDGDRGLAVSLGHNGIISADLWERLARRFPEMREGLSPAETFREWHLAAGSYGDHEEMFELFRSGQMPPERAAGLFVALSPSDDHDREITSRMIDDGLISADDVSRLTADADIHRALLCATHPRVAAGLGNLVTLDAKMLAATAEAVTTRKIELPRDKNVNSWEQLPNQDDMKLSASSLRPLLEARKVAGLRLEVPQTRRDLVKLSEEMRNCLSGYVDDIAAGRRFLAFTRTADDIYAVMWNVEREEVGLETMDVISSGHLEGGTDDAVRPIKSITIAELNSTFNEDRVPLDFRRAIERVTTQFNEGTLQPVVLDDEKPTGVVRRRRNAIPPLVPSAGHQGNGSLDSDAPSMLARPQQDEGRNVSAAEQAEEIEGRPPASPPSSQDIGHDLS